MEIPSTFPITLEDSLMHQVFSLLGDGSPKFLLTLDGRIDEDRLRKAVRLSLDAERILGCRFADRRFRPAWVRREDLDQIPLCDVISCADGMPCLAEFLWTPIDVTRDPLVKVRVVRAASDTVCIKVAHEVADGPSAKDYVHLLFQLYRRLKDDPGYRPPPNPTGVRSVSEVFRQVGFGERLRRLLKPRSARRPRSGRGQWWFSRGNDGSSPQHGAYLLLKLPAERVALLKEYGWQRNATITAVLLAAFYLALRTLAQPLNEEAVEIQTSVDLRRFLPRERRSTTPGNVLTPVIFCLDGQGETTFDGYVGVFMKQLQEALLDPFRTIGGTGIVLDLMMRALGLPVVQILVRPLVRRGKKMLRSLRSVCFCLINFGTLAPELGAAGEPRIVDGHFLGLAAQVGLLQFGVSDFQERITVSVGFSDRFVDQAAVRSLLEEMDRTLPYFAEPAEITAITGEFGM
jgi:NRPS condensation-like uncharacterized protein